MTTTSMTVGGARAIEIEIIMSFKGAWIADCDLDPDDAKSPPTGAVTIQIGSKITMKGTVDPTASGRFVSTYRLRVVGGGNGWAMVAKPQDFANDAGVSSTQVYNATAALVGETVNDPNPVTFPSKFVRTAGPASRVFGDRQWYVDPSGVTQIQTWPAVSPDASFELLDFDGETQRGQCVCDALVVPGTTFTDKRVDGTFTVNDVVHKFSREGNRCDLYFATNDVARLASALLAMVREMSGRAFLRNYPYRYVSKTGTGASARLNLQAVDTTLGVPDLAVVPVMPGVAGVYNDLTPSQIVMVAFLGAAYGDFSAPVIVGFDTTTPKTVNVEATDSINLHPGGTLAPVARLGDAVSVFFPPSIPFTGTISGAPVVGVLTITQAAPGTIQGGSGKVNSG